MISNKRFIKMIENKLDKEWNDVRKDLIKREYYNKGVQVGKLTNMILKQNEFELNDNRIKAINILKEFIDITNNEEVNIPKSRHDIPGNIDLILGEGVF